MCIASASVMEMHIPTIHQYFVLPLSKFKLTYCCLFPDEPVLNAPTVWQQVSRLILRWRVLVGWQSPLKTRACSSAAHSSVTRLNQNQLVSLQSIAQCTHRASGPTVRITIAVTPTSLALQNWGPCPAPTPLCPWPLSVEWEAGARARGANLIRAEPRPAYEMESSSSGSCRQKWRGWRDGARTWRERQRQMNCLKRVSEE